MKITLLCVGKLKVKYLKEAVADYSKRLQPFSSLEIIELPDEKCPESYSAAQQMKVLETEGDRIVSRIPDTALVVALDIQGKKMDSENLSRKLAQYMNSGKNQIIFCIGGSLGLDPRILKRSDLSLSFSDMTFPHGLMRVILLEQIYRSFKILKNEPYHK